jgi:SAM-dependent methyltransferase
MIDVLRAATTGLDVAVEQMDGQALAVEDGRFDAAASLFGLIFFPDLVAGARELRRAVRADGRVAVVAWDEAGFPIPPLVGRTLRRVLPDVKAGMNVAMRLGHPDPLAALLREAGLHDVEVREVTHGWRPSDPAAFLRSVPQWAQPLRPLFDGMTAEQLAHAADACAQVFEEMSGGTGELSCTALVGLGTH